MVSFAFWYEEVKKTGEGDLSQGGQEPGKELFALMNFNLWCQCGWGSNAPYLDIGFKVTNLSLAEALYFYLPFELPSPYDQHIEDLGVKFTKTELVDAVFNQNYFVEVAASSKTINVKASDPKKGSDVFRIYEFDIAHDIEVEPFTSSCGDKGTILKIPVAHIVAKPSNRMAEEGSDVYYFRFRIKDLPLDFLIHPYTPPHKVLQSIFNATYMIDFRYQNARSLDKSLVERFYEPGHHIVNVTEVHFLLITKAYVNVSGEYFKSTRKIERRVWREYVNGYDTEDLVAYHHVDLPTAEAIADAKARAKEFDDDETPAYVPSGEMFARLQVEKSLIGRYILINSYHRRGGVGGRYTSDVYSVVAFFGYTIVLRESLTLSAQVYRMVCTPIFQLGGHCYEKNMLSEACARKHGGKGNWIEALHHACRFGSRLSGRQFLAAQHWREDCFPQKRLS